MRSLFRILSIAAYLSIIFKGMMLPIPFGFHLVFGLADAEPVTRTLMILADCALVCLCISATRKRTKDILIFETAAYFILLLPLVRILTYGTVEEYNYLLFIVPTACFIILYPVSLFFACRELKQLSSAKSD